MNYSYRFPSLVLALALTVGLSAPSASALDLDWSGTFRTEAHWVKDYNMDNGIGRDARDGQGGYYIPGGGSKNAHFQTLFLKLRPKLIVNDNISIKSEWWVGDPMYGFFGGGQPYAVDQRRYNSTYSRGSTITAQRVWADLNTDFATVQIGRAPLNYGLGIIWNSGDGMFDRYASTGDVIRLVSKFGSFSFIPQVIKYGMGNSVAGSCDWTGACSQRLGGGGMSDYSVAMIYENRDEQLEGGVNFIKRVAGSGQDSTSGFTGISPAGTTDQVQGMNFNTWDIYARKSFGKFSLGGELPITSGDVGGAEYSTYAVALETTFKANEAWDFYLKGGQAPGQPTSALAASDSYKAFYFHHNYKIAMIMFNYQLANFAGPNTQNDPTIAANNVTSIYDNPMTNANYLNFGGAFTTEKWKFRLNLAWAQARETAESGKAYFFNTWDRRYVANTLRKQQGESLGWEMDYGTTFNWDDTMQFMFDFGWFFPGDFYRFTNHSTDATPGSVFATTFKVGINF